MAVAALYLLLGLQGSAVAASRYSIDIPEQPLGLALKVLTVQTGVQIAGFSDVIEQDVRVGPVRGSLSAEQALAALLRGKSIGYRVINERMIAILPADASTTNATVLNEPAHGVPHEHGPPRLPAIEQAAESSRIAEIVVTGSRILRGNLESPTPISIVNQEAIDRSAEPSLAELLNSMPEYSGAQTVNTSSLAPSLNWAGISGVALRHMGSNRTLVLLDGQRSVAATSDGVVDTGNFPQQLVSRVETVTGGTSAVYGSDAVAGVVNFVLDKKFSGFKGEVSAGATTYGDSRSWSVALSQGLVFDDGRGHLLLSGEFLDDGGVLQGGGAREWTKSARNYYVNPNYDGSSGEPEFLLADNVFLSQATHGGIITSGPLRGIAFGEGGVPYQFQYGVGVPRDNFMSGGDYRSTLIDDAFSLSPSKSRKNVYARLAYDVTESSNLYFQISRGVLETYAVAFPHYQVGAGPQVLTGNPFIPAEVQSLMTGFGVASFRLGTMNYDMPFVSVGTTRAANRYVIGGEGTVHALDTDWSWSAYAQLGETTSSYSTYNVENLSRYALALDAVRDPVSGGIVCRSTLTDVDNGCVPWNPMGVGVNTPAARRYLLGTAHSDQTTRQIVYAAQITGTPLATSAGTVAVALSGEYRKEEATIDADPVSMQGGWRSGNLQSLAAGYHVAEAAVEANVPLLTGLPWVQAWDASAAFRVTDYEFAGRLNTWKVGMTYTPVQGVRLRGTVSRDTRAPSISETFQSYNIGLGASFDPETNSTPTYIRTQPGNRALRPERGNSFTVGTVLEPTFARALRFTADYWEFVVKDAVTLLNSSQIIDLCYGGWAQMCSNITRVDGVITTVEQGNYNLARQTVSGIDVSADYKLPLASMRPGWPGAMEFRLTGTQYFENVTDDGVSLPDDVVGTVRGVPATVLTTDVGYSSERLSVVLSIRHFSSVVPDNDYIECRSGCPASTIFQRTFDSLDVQGATYLDASIGYRLMSRDGSQTTVKLNVKNLSNRDPELTPSIGTSGLGYVYPRSFGGRWDVLGRLIQASISYRF